MADPLSVVTTTVSLIVMCKKVVGYISDTRAADMEVRFLKNEVLSLSAVLEEIDKTFNQLKDRGIDLQTWFEGSHWKSASRSMEDCTETLEQLEKVLVGVKVEDGAIFQGTRTRAALDRQSGEINALRRDVEVFRQTMQLSLQLICLYSPSLYTQC